VPRLPQQAAAWSWRLRLVVIVVYLGSGPPFRLNCARLRQPPVVGRMVKLHPLAIILVLAVGGIVTGIPGAIVAVPATAVIFFAGRSCGRSRSHGRRPAAGSRLGAPGGGR
jgi:predicted PurR-regulated permease PerM